jgi:endo-1,4-beta-D-glucanase Y
VEFVQTVVRENLNSANGILANAAPRLAEELVRIALDPAVKAYARTSAISECFRILNQNVLEADQRRQLQAIRNQLQAIEDGVDTAQVIDV